MSPPFENPIKFGLGRGVSYNRCMLTYLQGIILGSLQGISELFPISSLGHSVILPRLLGWTVNQQDPIFLMFLVATHAATALVLLLFYWRDWVRIVRGVGRSLRDREIKATDADAKLGWLIVAATIPTGIVGLLLKDTIRQYLLTPQSAAAFLIANGVLLYGAEKLRRRVNAKNHSHQTEASDTRIAGLSWGQGIKVGLMQVLALVPGFSRTGSTIVGGLMTGLSHEDAVRFSFLLSTPIIGAAAVLELPALFTSGNQLAIQVSVVGALCSAVFAYLAVRFLTKYFSTERHSLMPFAMYCLVVGTTALILVSAG